MKKFLIIISIIFLLIFGVIQYRHFYRVDGLTFTVWKQWNGFCYITPYRYWGLSAPKNDYIKASNVSDILIYVGADTTLSVFTHYIYADSIICNFRNYKHHFFSPDRTSLDSIHEWERKIDSYNKSGLPFIQMELKEFNIYTRCFENESK